MSSQLQIQSARKNGAKSRGPVTPEGKAISSANSRKHGLLAEAIVIRGEAADHLAALSARFHGEFRPRTETETHHVETMILCRWRLLRVWEFESASFNQEIEKLAAANGQDHRTRASQSFKNLADHSRLLDLLNRYETRFARDFIRAHNALMELKAKPVSDWSDEEEHSVPDDAAPQPTPGSAQILPNEPDC